MRRWPKIRHWPSYWRHLVTRMRAVRKCICSIFKALGQDHHIRKPQASSIPAWWVCNSLQHRVFSGKGDKCILTHFFLFFSVSKSISCDKIVSETYFSRWRRPPKLPFYTLCMRCQMNWNDATSSNRGQQCCVTSWCRCNNVIWCLPGEPIPYG